MQSDRPATNCRLEKIIFHSDDNDLDKSRQVNTKLVAKKHLRGCVGRKIVKPQHCNKIVMRRLIEVELAGKMNNILRENLPLTVLLFCFTGGSAGGLLAKPTELIVVPMATCLGLGFRSAFLQNIS